MFFSNWSKSAKIIGGTVALSVVGVPVAVLADASNPIYVPKKKAAAKAKPKARVAKAKPRAVAKPVAQPPMIEAPVYTPTPAPVYTPAPPPPPAPVYTPPPPVAPAPVAAPVAAKGGNGWLLGLLGAAAVVGGIVLASGGDDSPTSP